MSGVVSGEGVALDLDRAGVGSRMVAAALDLLLQFVILIAVATVDGVVGAGDDAAVAALLTLELVAIFAGYPIICEWLTRGRTLGKMALGLRVVRDDGGPIGFRQALVRGLSGLIIEKPGLFVPIGTAAGLLTMIFNPAGKRIGDLMAGTFVITERAGTRNELAAPVFPVPYPLQPWAMSLDLSRLSDELALSVRQFVLRAHQFTPSAAQHLGEDLRARVLAVTSPPPPPGVPTPVVLTTVLAERRRRAEQPPRTITPVGKQPVGPSYPRDDVRGPGSGFAAPS